MNRFIIALVVALFALALGQLEVTNASDSELTSGYYGEVYVIVPGGAMCSDPVPDDDPDTLDFTPVDLMWLEYGKFANIPAYQPDMYMYNGWTLIIVEGTPCLVAHGVVGTENPLGGSGDWVVENDSVITAPEESPAHSDTTTVVEIDQEEQSPNIEVPAVQPISHEVAVEPATAPVSQAVVSGLPNTGAGSKKMLKADHAAIIFFAVAASSLGYATYKERKEQAEALFGRVKEGSPKAINIAITLLLVLLSPAIVVGMATYLACRAAYTVAEILFLLVVCFWPAREQKSPKRSHSAAVLIR